MVDAYVFGIPDEKYGEEVAAWIKLRLGSNLVEDGIRNFCIGKISHQKIPKYVKFMDDFPMTANGKIQKFKMKEILIKELGLC
ncbi:MAG: hypothetical protein KAI20_05915 [Thermoplasmatales archaeon]|nr:hypothetical protein [Thermoplasmatales archaeon]